MIHHRLLEQIRSSTVVGGVWCNSLQRHYAGVCPVLAVAGAEETETVTGDGEGLLPSQQPLTAGATDRWDQLAIRTKRDFFYIYV